MRLPLVIFTCSLLACCSRLSGGGSPRVTAEDLWTLAPPDTVIALVGRPGFLSELGTGITSVEQWLDQRPSGRKLAAVLETSLTGSLADGLGSGNLDRVGDPDRDR